MSKKLATRLKDMAPGLNDALRELEAVSATLPYLDPTPKNRVQNELLGAFEDRLELAIGKVRRRWEILYGGVPELLRARKLQLADARIQMAATEVSGDEIAKVTGGQVEEQLDKSNPGHTLDLATIRASLDRIDRLKKYKKRGRPRTVKKSK